MSKALSTLPLEQLPKLFVFDLDYTIWPLWCDTHITAPLRADGVRVVRDSKNYKVELYRDVVEIFEAIYARSIPIAIASRTSDADIAEELLQLFDMNQYILYKEMYPGSKLKHFERFHVESGIAYEDMVFFDDEKRNIVELGRIGVTCEEIESDGTTWGSVGRVLKAFAEAKKSQR